MPRTNQVAVIGSDLEFDYASGSQRAGPFKFAIHRGKHAIVCQDDSLASAFTRLVVQKLQPSAGVLSNLFEKVRYFSAYDSLDPNTLVADELGYGEAVRAARQIRAGSTDARIFEIHADNWDAEERCYSALNALGIYNIDLLQPLANVGPDVLMLVRLAGLHIHQPTLIVWERPTFDLTHKTRELFLEFLAHTESSVIVLSWDEGLLSKIDNFWRLQKNELDHFEGSYKSFAETHEQQLDEAIQEVARAEHELDLRIQEVEKAHAKRQARRERAQKFADTGIPKVHRGNMKRKSQESMARAKASDEQKIRAAEQALIRARERHEALK